MTDQIITMQDVRLMAGEGKLAAHHVLDAVNIILRQRAERGAPAQQMQWQPINTAPRDGTRVDLWHPVKRRIASAFWEKADYSPGQTWGWSSLLWGRITGATHWMPVPEGPALPSTLLGTPEDRTDGR